MGIAFKLMLMRRQDGKTEERSEMFQIIIENDSNKNIYMWLTTNNRIRYIPIISKSSLDYIIVMSCALIFGFVMQLLIGAI